MQRQREKVRFRLIGDKRPVSFEVPLKNLLLPRGNEGLKKVHYIPSAPSIWADEYKGDDKPKSVWIEDGVIDVDINDRNLLTIMRNHPWCDVWWEQYDEQEEAQKELRKMRLEDKANERVNIANDTEAKANAIAIFGSPALDWSPTIVRVNLKKFARDEPGKLLDTMAADEYHAKYVAGLSLLRGTLKINATRTAVTWEDGKVLIRVASGQDPAEKLATYLSQTDEESKLVLQELGERIKLSYEKSKKPTGEDAIEKILESDSDKDETASEKTDPAPEMTLEEAQNLFKKQTKRNVPPKFKNDIEWIKERLELD